MWILSTGENLRAHTCFWKGPQVHKICININWPEPVISRSPLYTGIILNIIPLNFSKKPWKSVCISYHPSTLKHHGLWKFTPREDKNTHTVISQYHGWWWLGYTRIQGINSHGIDLVFPEYSGLSTRRFNSCQAGTKIFQADQVNTMYADAVAPCITKSSMDMIMTATPWYKKTLKLWCQYQWVSARKM